MPGVPADAIAFLDAYLVRRAPVRIPERGRELIVAYMPWATALLLVLLVPALLLVQWHGTPLPQLRGVLVGFRFVTPFVIAEVVLMAAALPGLFARTMSGWTLMFYARLVSFVSSLIVGAFDQPVFTLAISLYVLFQVRTCYRERQTESSVSGVG